ncbi:MAG: hypothetical protein AVDCRST_MAG93-359 [uncultured Chloroflexia bacterium]|uniref:Uncharacterized protein n=1 Tax=uncultured Chloroflexia bacterium TaxID=1672391 RepID=A0A6J4HBL8_9CHLR|nr:MAG: hypothetical protein AVDCRST_MAG93-359 [uncultured Chloroflexia bacterium]
MIRDYLAANPPITPISLSKEPKNPYSKGKRDRQLADHSLGMVIGEVRR